MRLQEQHQVRGLSLRLPRLRDLLHAPFTEPGYLRETPRIAIQHRQAVHTELRYDATGEAGSHPWQHARAEILLETFDRLGRQFHEALHFELFAVALVLDIRTGDAHAGSGTHGGEAADGRDRRVVATAFHLADLDHTKTGFF